RCGRPSSFSTSRKLLMTAALIAWRAESKQVKQVPDRRRVLRHISIVGAYNGIGKVVAAAIADRGQVPVALDELENGNVVGILMRNVAGLGEGRDHDQRYARPIAEEVQWLGVS